MVSLYCCSDATPNNADCTWRTIDSSCSRMRRMRSFCSFPDGIFSGSFESIKLVAYKIILCYCKLNANLPSKIKRQMSGKRTSEDLPFVGAS